MLQPLCRSQLPGSAVFSDCRRYRYLLTRCWDTQRPQVLFVGLNPSTADATRDDPTLRRCVGFARRWGYGGVVLVNLFALRTPSPTVLFAHPEPIGPENDAWLLRARDSVEFVIFAWGACGDRMGRASCVKDWFENPYCLGLTKTGEPRHPLYLPADTQPIPFGSS